jgi:NitT/TauT family transport system ATP-binding protein
MRSMAMRRAENVADRAPASVPTTGPPLVSYRDVDKVFGAGSDAVHAVERVSLDVLEGEFLVFVGPSGCGKTTLMRMTAGLAFPTGGEVCFDGAPVKKIGSEVGFVTQENKLFPWMTLVENVAFPLEARGIGRAERRARAIELLATMELDDFADRYPAQLSGGMQRRGAIARMLIYDPRVILMDEPFGALDALTRRLLQQELKRICDARSVTVIFVTHDLFEAVTLGDRIVVFSRRPARIKEIVTVPHDMDRSGDNGEATSAAAHDLQQHLWSVLHDELEVDA